MQYRIAGDWVRFLYFACFWGAVPPEIVDASVVSVFVSICGRLSHHLCLAAGIGMVL